MQPKIYSAHDHHIREHHIDPDALHVIRRLREAGFVAYLVGGGVRDLLLRREPKDFDISTSARPEEIKHLFRRCLLIGRRFRLAHVRFGRKIIEVATFRAGDPEEAALIVRDNVWGEPEEDVLRRDFTINGLFYDPTDHTIIDYVGGFADLQQNLLRVIGDPVTRFIQDPVRMIRALKFRARFGFELERSAAKALIDCRGEILKSSKARLLEEMMRMLESGASQPFFEIMAQQGFMDMLFPFIGKVVSEGSTRESPYAYLGAADQYIQSRKGFLPNRSVLCCCLLFPILNEIVHQFHEGERHPPSLGLIHEMVHELLNQAIVQAFMPFPRRHRALMAFVLESQYRLTPLTKRKLRRQKLASGADFPLALQFLRLRTLVTTDLEATYQDWKQLARELRQTPGEMEPRRPRRRRRRS